MPRPRINLTRFLGCLPPKSKHRVLVTPARRGNVNKARGPDDPPTLAERHACMTWAQRLKRVFRIDIETCSACGGPVKVIACIEDPEVIERILDHLKNIADTTKPGPLPES